MAGVFQEPEDQPANVRKNAEGPSWGRHNWPLTPRDELTSALDGNWAEVEKAVGTKLAAKAQARGELTAADVHQATRDSVRALMLIRAYRMRGHFHAKLDPLGIEPPRDREELDPRSYGFVEAISTARSSSIMCWAWNTRLCGKSSRSANAPTARRSASSHAHYQRRAEGWIQERIEGPDKKSASPARAGAPS